MEKQSRRYKKLADKYRDGNINQSWLCYENARYHCTKEEDRTGAENFCLECQKEMELLERSPNFSVAKTAIIILSYNHGELTKACIESIRQNNAPGTYELIVVDNASTDGVQEWLRKQEDILLIENEDNQGFPRGCNQGIALAGKNANIFLLNNDTIVPENAIFWLRMALYENERIGAAGSVSNQVVNYQQVPEQFDTTDEWLAFAKKNNVPMEYPYEKKSWLVGFAMLIKRNALNAVLEAEQAQLKNAAPMALDTRFSPGNFEDNDLSIRLLLAGYQLRLVKNSFIFHYGSKSFQKMPERFLALLKENQKKLAEKYGIDLIPASRIETALVDMVKPDKPSFRVLEIGCKLGASLARIESRYPKAAVLGIEGHELLARLAKNVVPVISGNFMEVPLPEILADGKYDYVIMDGILSPGDEGLLAKAGNCLKARGTILACICNTQCISANVQEQTHTKMTLEQIVHLCDCCHMQIREFNYRTAELSPTERQQVSELCAAFGSQMRPLYEAEKFVFEISL